MKKDKCLLIWPPFFNSDTLPLPIPFLTAHLKQQGFNDVEVLDMNGVYLSTIQPHWTVYMLLRLAHRILKKKNLLFSPAGAWIGRKIASVLEEIEKKEIKFLFPSLQSILTSLDQGAPRPQREKVERLLKDVLSRDDFGFVGISVSYPYQIFFALLIARILKKKRAHKVRIVLGGAQITKNIDELIKNKDTYESVDFFVVGEGEEPLLGLLAGKVASDIPNLYFKDPQGSESYVFSGRTFRLSPDHYPIPDFSGFDRNAFQDTLPILVTSGCPWGRCAFCTQADVLGKKFCRSSMEHIVRNIKGMIDTYGTYDFNFMDNGLQAGFMRDIACALLREGFKINWTAQVILDRQFEDPDFCRLLRESGLKILFFGLESISPRVLKLMNKYHQGLTPEGIKNILTVIHGAGIGIGVFVLFGFPTETIVEARQTVDFLLSNIHAFDFINMNPFFLDDFTRVFQEPEKFGVKKIHTKDKFSHMGRRLTYAYETEAGMSQAEAFKFTNESVSLVRQALKNRQKL